MATRFGYKVRYIQNDCPLIVINDPSDGTSIDLFVNPEDVFKGLAGIDDISTENKILIERSKNQKRPSKYLYKGFVIFSSVIVLIGGYLAYNKFLK